MKTEIKRTALAVMAVALLAIILSTATGSANSFIRKCPYLLDLNGGGLKAEVVEISFPEVVQGIDGNRIAMPENKKDKYRLALVTIKITKPAGKRLTAAAADFTLHYCHGNGDEVAPCEGISWFNTVKDSDRPMKLARITGPGWIKQTTGARATKSAVVYIDAVFSYTELDMKNCWICLGQSAMDSPYECNG
jgi:hypothetical protein